jgi:DNA-binding XRE family transcriptional regulator
MTNSVPDLRAKRGWTQSDLAKQLRVSRQTVNAIETGRNVLRGQTSSLNEAIYRRRRSFSKQNPTAHGGSASDAFHLVIPSIPGYGSES